MTIETNGNVNGTIEKGIGIEIQKKTASFGSAFNVCNLRKRKRNIVPVRLNEKINRRTKHGFVGFYLEENEKKHTL